MSELDPERCRSIARFCLARLKEGGGFAATPHLPPTIEDTRFAVKILDLLKAPFPQEETIAFLKAKAQRPLPPRLAFFVKETLELLGVRFRPSVEITHTTVLEEQFYLLRLGLRVREVPPLPASPTVKDLYLYAALRPKEAKNYVPYVLASQNPDGGFGFYPGTTSFLENTYYAFSFLRRFGYEPRDVEGLRAYVLACWRREAFARSPKGVPFLDATCYALEILVAL